MAVYLDTARNRFRRMIMCHMIADDLEELHQMAETIGMQRSWFQSKSFPHYDVCLTRKKLAIQNGAILLERRPFIYKLREIRAKLKSL